MQPEESKEGTQRSQPGADEANFSSQKLPRVVPSSARSVLQDLYQMFIGTKVDKALEGYTASLLRLPDGDLEAVLNGVERLITKATELFETRAPYHAFLLGAYNTIQHLGSTRLGERAEGLYEKLLPLYRKAGETHHLAYLLVAIGGIYEHAEDLEKAGACYEEATAVVAEKKLGRPFWILRAYEFALKKSLLAIGGDAFTLDPKSEVELWSGKIMAVLDDPVNKGPRLQSDPQTLSALSNIAIGLAWLEAEGARPAGAAKPTYERMLTNASIAEDPQLFPCALLEYAKYHALSGDWGESLGLRILAVDQLQKIKDPNALKLASETLKIIQVSIASRPPPSDEEHSF